MIQHQCLPRHHRHPEASAPKAAEKPQLKSTWCGGPTLRAQGARDSKPRKVRNVFSLISRKIQTTKVVERKRRLERDVENPVPQRWSKIPKIRVSTLHHDCKNFGCLRKKKNLDGSTHSIPSPTVCSDPEDIADRKYGHRTPNWATFHRLGVHRSLERCWSLQSQ